MYSFFITEISSEDQIKIQGFLFDKMDLQGKMTLLINDLPNGVIYPKFTFFKLSEFVLDKQYESDGNLETRLSISYYNITNIQYLAETDYKRFKEKHLIFPYSLKDSFVGASGKTYYSIDPQTITYQKGGIVISGYQDTESDTSSDLTSYDQDGNYIYENLNDPFDDLINQYGGTKI